MSARELELLISRVLEYDVPIHSDELEWLFTLDQTAPFLAWLCDNIRAENVIPPALLHAYVTPPTAITIKQADRLGCGCYCCLLCFSLIFARCSFNEIVANGDELHGSNLARAEYAAQQLAVGQTRSESDSASMSMAELEYVAAHLNAIAHCTTESLADRTCLMQQQSTELQSSCGRERIAIGIIQGTARPTDTPAQCNCIDDIQGRCRDTGDCQRVISNAARSRCAGQKPPGMATLCSVQCIGVYQPTLHTACSSIRRSIVLYVWWM
jgi:hypothetical protein